MAMKRVFIGMPAGRALTGASVAFRHSHPELKVRWIRPENLHVTMVPPWELHDAEPVCSALGEMVSGLAGVPICFDTVSLGPDRRHPRLVWATGDAPVELASLFSRLQASFGRGQDATRGFLLHLTIARFKQADARPMSATGLCEPVEWRGVLDQLCLYESILKHSGAEYRVLCRFPLSGRQVV